MLEYLKNKRILIIVAHPDDEVIGLGGTINLLVTEYGCEIKCVILGEGITSRDNKRNLYLRKSELETHKSNIISAKEVLEYQELKCYDLPDNRFDSINLLDVIKIIENEKRLFQPEVIFTHHYGDLNIDHQITFNAVLTANRPVPNEIVKSIITFETFSGTEWQANIDSKVFRPNLFFRLNEKNINSKIKAMDCYEFERRSYPHPRSSQALRISAQKNGISVGYELAEAFCIIRTLS